MEKVSSNGLMGRFTKDNGKMAKKMAVESGKAHKVKVISDSGNMARFRDLVFTSPRIGIGIKVNLRTHKSKVMELKDILTDRHM